uniref:Uncharacterized protein n=1 Tax=Trypanosoma brucei brucei (strain 927/4 GUTat10.1) TaxID=185431 RepID=Q4FKR4_TRYB2|nr:hypothetical protein Tb09.v4.0152 [Trypanosoma brucei brucei TREU927]
MSTTAVLFTFAEFAHSQEFPDILRLFPVPSPESWSFLCLRRDSVTVFVVRFVTESSAGVSRACELSPMVSTASRFATILVSPHLQVAVWLSFPLDVITTMAAFGFGIWLVYSISFFAYSFRVSRECCRWH